jgi:hypothetical protein
MRNLALVALLFVGPAAVASGTPDGTTPADETVCDNEPNGLYGLCVAYCEAMDCDYETPNASATACAAVLNNYTNRSGGAQPPCVDPGPPECTTDCPA